MAEANPTSRPHLPTTSDSSVDYSHCLLKIACVSLYHVLLGYFGAGMHFKFVSFMVVTPLVKVVLFNRLATAEDRWRYVFSVLHDWTMAVIVFKIVHVYLAGALYAFAPVVMTPVLLPLEYLQYRIFDNGRLSDYKIVSGDPRNLTIVIVVFALFYHLGTSSDFSQLACSYQLILLFFAIAFCIDLLFGSFHMYEHSVPWLWKKHMVHHEYKLEGLNFYANFHSEFWDGFIMPLPTVAMMSLTALLGPSFHNFAVYFDIMYSSSLSHHKYNTRVMNLFFFFELDVFDILFGSYRMSTYHNLHHKELNKRFGLYGFVSDAALARLLPASPQ